jgi:hypothetical protein
MVFGAVVIALLGLVLTAGSAPAAVDKTPVWPDGTLHCRIAGKTWFKPRGLISGGTSAFAYTVLITKFKSTSCSGTSGVTKLKGELLPDPLLSDDCSTFFASPFPKTLLALKKPKGAHKFYPDTESFLFTSGGIFNSTGPIELNLPGNGAMTPIENQFGYFPGRQVALHLVYNATTSSIARNCMPKNKALPGSGGLKKLSFAGASSLDIS